MQAKYHLDLTADLVKAHADYQAAEEALRKRQPEPYLAKLTAEQRAEVDALVADGYEVFVYGNAGDVSKRRTSGEYSPALGARLYLRKPHDDVPWWNRWHNDNPIVNLVDFGEMWPIPLRQHEPNYELPQSDSFATVLAALRKEAEDFHKSYDERLRAALEAELSLKQREELTALQRDGWQIEVSEMAGVKEHRVNLELTTKGPNRDELCFAAIRTAGFSHECDEVLLMWR